MTKKKKNKKDLTEEVIVAAETTVEVVEVSTSENVEAVEEVLLESKADAENVVVETNTAAAGDLVSDINEVESAVLALIFASPVALSLKKLKNLLNHGGYDSSQIELVLESLAQSFENKGVQLVKVAGGYQLRSNPKYSEIVQKLVEEKPQRLSKSALEVLAIVAYKQPITRADIDHVRGTDSGHLLKSLLEKNLVRTEGHKETAGRPLLYGTTPNFLEVFTLGSLDDLPAIEDFERELKDADSENGDTAVLEADPGFFDKPSALDAIADRGAYDTPAEDQVEAPDFGEADRAAEEVNGTGA